MPDSSSHPHASGPRRGTRAMAPAERRDASRAGTISDDRFFSQIVRSMRNGVIAFHRDGSLALMNDEAYRIFGLTREIGDIGRAFADVLRNRPDVVRVLG